jgi:hypothetical protein
MKQLNKQPRNNMIVKYPEIKVPAHINQINNNMSIEDTYNYFEWFINIKENRLYILYEQVFMKNNIEFSLYKLQALYYFFKNNIIARKRSIDEIEKERLKLPEAIRTIHKIPEYEFIEPTVSLIFDISIYFGELLRSEVSEIEWTIVDDKSMYSYGYPVLVKKNINSCLSPRWLIETCAIQIYENRFEEDGFTDMYNNWKNIFIGKPKDYLGLVESLSKKKKKK